MKSIPVPYPLCFLMLYKSPQGFYVCHTRKVTRAKKQLFRNRGENKKVHILHLVYWVMQCWITDTSCLDHTRLWYLLPKYLEIFRFLVLFISQVKHYQLCHLASDAEFWQYNPYQSIKLFSLFLSFFLLLYQAHLLYCCTQWSTIHYWLPLFCCNTQFWSQPPL